MKVQTKVFLSRDLSLALDEASRRTRRSKSEIAQVAIASYLSPDGDEAAEAAVVRRLDRISRGLERLERDVTISNEAVALFVKAWLTATPSLSAPDQKAQTAKGQERYAGFLEALSRRLTSGRLLRSEVLEEQPAKVESFAENAGAIGTFVGGLITGGAAGWAITYKSMKAKIMVGGRVADQSRARAGGDNVGGNKTTIGRID